MNGLLGGGFSILVCPSPRFPIIPIAKPPPRAFVAAMTIEAITQRICAFRDARDWQQFHNPKDLSVAIAAEAGELMQHFVWKTQEQSQQVVIDKRAEIMDEIADVAILLFELAHNLNIPLTEAMQAKLDRNELRYPADKARGNNLKYNEL
jgi:NTP pyrophosphatase (non-canonical NTP hydrolase)